MWKRLRAKANPAGSSEVWISFQNCHMLGKGDMLLPPCLTQHKMRAVIETTEGERGNIEQNSYVVFKANPRGKL